ncbi:MAG: O-antigen ligase family protein [Clostridia bacterium]|nr:O-antigen ligase family protein [Clostridia bacterium]
MSNRFVSFCDRIAMILLCIILFDSCIFGAGELISLGPIGYRQMLLLVLGMVSIPVMLFRWKTLIRNKYLWAVVAFFVWIAASCVLGFSRGNSVAVMIHDLGGLAYFAFLPIVISLLHSKQRLHLVMKCIIWGSFVLSLVALVHLILYLYAPDVSGFLINHGFELYFSRIGAITSSLPRLYFISGLYMVGGCCFSFYFFAHHQGEKLRWFYFVVPGLCVFASMISYTRSVYLALLVAALIVIVTLLLTKNRQIIKRTVALVVVTALICIVAGSVFSLLTGTNYISYAFKRTSLSVEGDDLGSTDEILDPELEIFNQATLESDKLRQLTLDELWDNIGKSPIVGLGMGSVLPSREYNEYFFLDIWSKAGIIGLILFLLPMFLIVFDLWKKKSTLCNFGEKMMWIAFLAGIVAYSFFNPYISSSLGIFIYSITIVVVSCKNPEEINLCETKEKGVVS